MYRYAKYKGYNTNFTGILHDYSDDNQQISSYAFDIEELALANSKGAKITEMPVEVHYTREGSFSRIRFGAIVKMFFDTLKIWWDLRIAHKYKLD